VAQMAAILYLAQLHQLVVVVVEVKVYLDKLQVQLADQAVAVHSLVKQVVQVRLIKVLVVGLVEVVAH
jgi:hypothetical protein